MANPLLQGVRVLDVSRLLPGPYCSLLLAQLGAEVIKIEEPEGGDYLRGLEPELFALVNRGKRSVTLDLRKVEDVDAFARLAATADVVLESFRPGVMDRLGCGYEVLRKVNPRLVYAALTGYGQHGPLRDRAGHDLNYLATAGVLDQIGIAGAAPAMSNLPIADLAGGGLHCALGIVAALLGARASGEGAFVDVAMLDGSFALNLMALTALNREGAVPARGTDMLSGGLPNYAVYECADGRHYALGALEPKFWAAFCAAAQRPDLARMPLTGAAAEATREQLRALFRTRSRDDWEQLLQGADCCGSAVLAPEEAVQHPQLLARGRVQREDGRLVVPGGLSFVGQALPPLAPAPALGEATRTLLNELDLDPATRDALGKPAD